MIIAPDSDAEALLHTRLKCRHRTINSGKKTSDLHNIYRSSRNDFSYIRTWAFLTRASFDYLAIVGDGLQGGTTRKLIFLGKTRD